MHRLVPLLAIATLSSGCVVTTAKQNGVDGALRDVGFSEEDARCVASRAGRQLTVRQLRSLQRAGAAMQQPVREMPVGDVIDAIRDNVEPATLSIIRGLATECLQQRRDRPQ